MNRRSCLLVAVVLLAGCPDKGGDGQQKKAATQPGPGPGTPPPRPSPTPYNAPAPPDLKEPPVHAVKAQSGLIWNVITPGHGADRPGRNDLVEVYLTGWTDDGKMHESSIAKGAPDRIPLNIAPAGFVEGIPLMTAGEKRRFWIPAPLGWMGKRGKPDAAMVYDIELVGFIRAPAAPPAADLQGPPKSARKLTNGVMVQTLQKGKGGSRKPVITDTVSVDFSVWTKDGRLAESTAMRGQPMELPATGMNPGFSTGLRQMSAGDKFRIWVPANMAFSDHPSREGDPAGALVYDVVLHSIK